MTDFLTQEILEDFWRTDYLIQYGDQGFHVKVAQAILEKIYPDLYVGRIDGIFGKLSKNAVLNFQQYRLLKETGVIDKLTCAEMYDAYRYKWKPGKKFMHPSFEIETYGPKHPKLGWIPDVALGRLEGGKISHFGGPKDAGDRCEGQAYISGAKNPSELVKKHTTLYEMGILRTGLYEKTKYPLVKDYKGRKRKAGTSWCLNPDSYYIAMRFKRSGGLYNEKNPRLIVWSEKTNRACVCLRTDYGPAKWTNRIMDLSLGALRYLDLKTDSYARVSWAPDNIDIGPILPRSYGNHSS